ncbi:MAG TPA: cytidine deaminase [Polyangiaceae bacterium]|nr:cytidine deaminase [Polyangiaceae bacterium]
MSAGPAKSLTSDTWRTLLEAANHVRDRAYAPYSDYRVGAAVLAPDGSIFAGCNVENASYGLALCAERSAVAHLIAAGHRRVAAVAIVTAGPEPGRPCGLCRQTLSEFADDDLPIGLAIPGDTLPRAIDRLGDIFAHPFRGDLVKKV